MCCLCMDIKGAFLLLYLMDSSVIVVISVINFSQQLWSSCRCINNHEIVKCIPIFEVTLFVQDECCMVIRSSWSYLPKNKFMITNLVVNSVILYLLWFLRLQDIICKFTTKHLWMRCMTITTAELWYCTVEFKYHT